MRCPAVVVILLAVTAGAARAQAPLPAVAPAVSCASLRGFDPGIPGAPTQIGDARETQIAGRGTCVVTGYISPQIRFELRMPLSGWTQRYLQTGCGGLCGNLRIDAPQRPCPLLERGDVAIASTDMGHQGRGGTWGASDPQLRVDFAYRGVHLTALVARALIARFYGQAPRWSYFSGCSDGGREALMEAQRYPADFDGIAAGAPAFNFLVQNTFYHAWNARTVAPDPTRGAVLLARDLPIVHEAVVAACDALDGVKDGIVSNPPACRFDPATVECRAPGQAGCLSRAAALAVAALYRGAHDAQGRKLVIGGPQPGSELSWEGVFVPTSPQGPILSAMFAGDVLGSLAYWRPLPPSWTIDRFEFTTRTLQALMPLHGLYDATDPDLSAFARRGGKLLVWHGWSDPHISPLNSIAYAQAVGDRLGTAASTGLLRLFLVPGLYHCGGGDGLTSIDVLTPLMEWVEQGRPPRLVASRSDADASAGKGRTIYPWPATSVLRSGEDPERPASWRPGPPLPLTPKLYQAWAGARLFDPGYQQECGFEGPTFVCRPRH